jgi:hypothetical protein
MINLGLWHYWSELRGVPVLHALFYMMFSVFYLLSAVFPCLLVLPIISIWTHRAVANADIATFIAQIFPLLAFYFFLLLAIGQRYLIPGTGRRGLWWRAGLVWLACWPYYIHALWQGITTGRKVPTREVTSKRQDQTVPRWIWYVPHFLLLALCAMTLYYSYTHRASTAYVWGMTYFLWMVGLSQVCAVIFTWVFPKTCLKNPPS